MIDTKKFDRFDQGRIFLLFYINGVILEKLAEAYDTNVPTIRFLINDYAKILRMPEWALAEVEKKLQNLTPMATI